MAKKKKKPNRPKGKARMCNPPACERITFRARCDRCMEHQAHDAAQTVIAKARAAA